MILVPSPVPKRKFSPIIFMAAEFKFSRIEIDGLSKTKIYNTANIIVNPKNFEKYLGTKTATAAITNAAYPRRETVKIIPTTPVIIAITIVALL